MNDRKVLSARGFKVRGSRRSRGRAGGLASTVTVVGTVRPGLLLEVEMYRAAQNKPSGMQGLRGNSLVQAE
jgi:hypothetical protein